MGLKKGVLLAAGILLTVSKRHCHLTNFKLHMSPREPGYQYCQYFEGSDTTGSDAPAAAKA